MGFVSADVGVANKRHVVALFEPSTTKDGDGGYTEAWAPLAPPTLSVEIRDAGASDMERATSGTISASATHVLTGDRHPQITTKTRVTFGARIFSVVGVVNPGEANGAVQLLCAEQVK